MVKETELYELLGCKPDVDQEDLKKAFRKAALKYHPDRFSHQADSPEAAAAAKKFAEINNAYDILKEPETRERYDRLGMKGVQEGGGDDEGGGDLFSAMFGGGGRGGRRREQKPKDTLHQLDVPLDQFYNGAVRKIAVTRQRLCEKCSGTGAKSGRQSTCDPCKGKGARTMLNQIAPGIVQPVQVRCNECRGSGQSIAPSDRCQSCSGERVVEDRKVFDVHVDKGMKHGDAVTFTGEGNQIPGVRLAGDVVVLLSGLPHDRFVRKGNVLLTKATIPLVDALCGFQVQVEHLDGRILVLNPLEGGQVLKPAATYVVAREGMFVKGTGGSERGELVVQVTIEFPDRLTEMQVEKLRSVLGPMTQPPPVTVTPAEGSYATTMTECFSTLEAMAKEGNDDATATEERGRGSPHGGPQFASAASPCQAQ